MDYKSFLSLIPFVVVTILNVFILIISIKLAKKHNCYYRLTRYQSGLKPKDKSRVVVSKEDITVNAMRYKKYCAWMWPTGIIIDMVIWGIASISLFNLPDGGYAIIMLIIWLIFMISSIFIVYEVLINFLSVAFNKWTNEDIENLWDAINWSMENEDWGSAG